MLLYGFDFLCFQIWCEQTDPQKFVYEDINIAAYLLVRLFVTLVRVSVYGVLVNVTSSLSVYKLCLINSHIPCRLQWSSGSMLACCARGPRIEPTLQTSFCVFHRKSMRYAAFGMGCTLTAVLRSSQPTTLRGTVNEYQPYG